MIYSSERRRLTAAYTKPLNAHAVLARCAAGLLVILGAATMGSPDGATKQEAVVSVSAPQGASGR
jgi:hypothetical protein